MATHLSVARGAVEDDRRSVFDFGNLGDFRLGAERVVADKDRRVVGPNVGKGDDLFLLRGAGAGALLFHQFLKAGPIHSQAAFTGHQLGEVEREALLVIEAEGDGTRNGAARREFAGFVFKQGDALIKGAIKGFFFDADHVGHHRAAGADLREDVAHRLGEDADELMEEAVLQAERTAVADRAAQDAAEHVVTVRVAGLDAVGDGKGKRPDVVRDNAEGHVILFLWGVPGRTGDGQGGAILFTREFFEAAEERSEDIALVVGDDPREILKVLRALHDSSDALKAHAGIDVAGGQGTEGAIWVGVELDED